MRRSRRLDFQIIEDDPYGFLADTALPPFASLAPERSSYVRSIAKNFAPGLRTAWLVAPLGQEDRAANVIRAAIWSAPAFGPAIASRWITDGTAATIEGERRAEARARQQIASTILKLDPARPGQEAMHLGLKMPPGIRVPSLTTAATSAGIGISPSSAFGIGSSPNAVRLSLCAPPPARNWSEGSDGLPIS